MPSQLEQRIAQFTDWRVKLVAAIDEFRAWQDAYGQADIEQTLRIYDLVEGLRNDRIRLAFLGESAEDKIGLINALLFSDLPGGLLPVSELVRPKAGDTVEMISVRFRTVGDMTCTCPVESIAATAGEIIVETATTRITERGATRMDDQTSEASMELRKKEGYF